MKRLYPVLVMLSLSLAGCIHYEEEITLESDGSGAILYHYWLNDRHYQALKDHPLLPFTRERAEARMASEHMKLGAFVSSKIGEDRHFNASFRFDDIRHLPSPGIYEAEPPILGKHPGGLWTFQRTIRGSGEADYDESLKELWAAYQMKFVVHFPGAVVEANTIDTREHTAIWIIPLADLATGAKRMTARYSLSKPRRPATHGKTACLKMPFQPF